MTIPDALEPSSAGGNRLTAIYIAVLAVLLAIGSIGDDDATKTMMRSSIDAADAYAFFQAKNIRQTSYELAADRFEADLKDPALSAEARAFRQAKIDAYRATAARYESEPAKGEGKIELIAKARALEAQRDRALQRDPYFDFAQAFLQIAIVLASSALILGSGFLLWMSGALGVAGALSMLNAFTLAVSFPFVS